MASVERCLVRSEHLGKPRVDDASLHPGTQTRSRREGDNMSRATKEFTIEVAETLSSMAQEFARALRDAPRYIFTSARELLTDGESVVTLVVGGLVVGALFAWGVTSL